MRAGALAMTFEPTPPGGLRVRRAELRAGDVVGGHRIVASVGRDRIGVGYVGEHVASGRRALIKVLRPEGAGSPAVIQRFFAGARAAAALHHPGVAAIHDFGFTEDELAYVVTELLDGESLADLLRRGARPSLPVALGVLRQVAAALGAAHDRGLVHGGLAASSVLLVGGEPSTVKLLDLGVARLGPDGGAPADPRDDLYALGCLGFEVLAGRPPFVAGSAYELAEAHLSALPPDVREHAAEVPAEVAALVDRLLAKDRAVRFQTAHDLAAALDELAARAGLDLVATAQRPRAHPPAARRWWAAVAALVLAAGLALARCT